MESVQSQNTDELQQLLAANPSIKAQAQSLWDYLPDCEYELILFMVAQNVWQGPVPPPPDGFQPGDGTIELGLFRYWIANPNQLDLSKFSPGQQLAILGLCLLIDGESPATQMTAVNFSYFKTGELIYTDGSVLSMRTYTTYDQGWFIAFLNLTESLLRSLWYNNGVFPIVPPPVINGPIAGAIKIALIGDWGTGDAVAKAIMQRVVALNPDYIVHVGDVYYSGSPSPSEPGSPYYFALGEEYRNLLETWGTAYSNRSFTLNSNHEMYSGANGYFVTALQKSTAFIAQKGSSCWAYRFGGWTILGLDTAFMGTSADAFMTGSIGGANGTQGKWIASLGLDPQKVIVLTHHNGFAQDCTSLSPLWNEIRSALNGDPYAWYWGHVHYGIVYDAPITIPSIPGQPGLTTKTYSRCLGHGALPYGPASDLKGKPIAWSSGNMQPPPSRQLYNGFAMLTLSTNGAGQMTNITETFYDLGSANAVWSKKLL